MAKKNKLNIYNVTLGGTLPCTATIEIQAENESEAKELALERWNQADWDGADYERPEGATVEVCKVEKFA